MKKFIPLFLAAILIAGVTAAREVGNLVDPTTIAGRAYYAESNDDLYKLAFVVHVRPDNPGDPDMDNGNEICANIGMDCIDVNLAIAPANDNFLQHTCTTFLNPVFLPTWTYCN